MRAGWQHTLQRFGRRHWILLAVLAVLTLVAALLDRLVDAPVQSWLQREAGRRVAGYSVHIDRVDVEPWLLSWTLYGVRFAQDAHPKPPVATIEAIAIDLDWAAAVRGRLTGVAVIIEPVVHIDTTQLRAEWNDRTPFDERGWQRVWELYPLKFNQVRVRNGTVTYVDKPSGRAVHLDRVSLHAANIRHVTAAESVYPSPFDMQARVFRRGTLTMTGHANFLLRPHAGIDVVAALDGVPLAALGHVVDDYHVRLSDGIVSGKGQFELAPDKYIANMQVFEVRQLRLDYVAGKETPATAGLKRGLRTATRYVDRSPALRFRARNLLLSGNFGYVSSTQPPYRVFLDGARLRLTNVSNRADQGESHFTLAGLFMGSGDTTVRGVLRPGPGTDFALDARVLGTQLTALNDVLRAHGRVDVSDGWLSVFSQLHVSDGQIRGYVKPLFREVEVHGAEDRNENIFQRLYEAIVEQLAKVLENESRDEVATVVNVSGPLQDPDLSTLQVIGNLLRNAFIQAILPGFDAERASAPVRQSDSRRPDTRSGPAREVQQRLAERRLRTVSAHN
jgi:hypothetical protein